MTDSPTIIEFNGNFYKRLVGNWSCIKELPSNVRKERQNKYMRAYRLKNRLKQNKPYLRKRKYTAKPVEENDTRCLLKKL
jgi:hypothetical protein